MKTDNYQPFGEEWKNELMKLPKNMIINMYRNSCLELQELQKNYTDACNAAREQEQRAKQAEKNVPEAFIDPAFYV